LSGFSLHRIHFMFLLAIDTSGRNGSIALARAGEHSGSDDDVEMLGTIPLIGGTFSAQLIPQISALVSSQGVSKHDIGAFAVASGPGSFTGLRVGLAAVKALAEVLRKPIVSVSLLELCVFVGGAKGKVLAALDAGRHEIYVGEFEEPLQAGGTREYLLTASEFVSEARGRTVITPDSVIAGSASDSGLSVRLIAPLSAAALARLGWQKLRRGQTVAPEQLEANYIRRTDAEMLEKIRS
jgi:tRNA threonylcarbamoyladenosine biosynthesis protein TsaB